MNIVKFIKMIEKSSYPRVYRALQNTHSIDDIVEYCEADEWDDLLVLTGEKFYFLAVKSTCEIVDLAGEMSMKDIVAVTKTVKRVFSGKIISMNMRESTSYRAVGLIGEIIEDNVYTWGKEVFHDVKVKVRLGVKK